MQQRDYVPDAIDAAYIDAAAAPVHPVFAAIEAAAWAVDPHVPILDRAAGHVLAVLAAGRSRIVEVGTAFGYSTLWMALAQPRDGTIVTIDPDTARTARARAWWREAGVADERITVVSRPALDAFAADEPSLRGPFDLAFIDALKDEYAAYLAALRPRLAPHGLRRRRQRPVERPRGARRRGRRLDRGPAGLQRGGAARPGLARHDPAGRGRPAGGDARLTASRRPRLSDPGPPGSIRTSDSPRETA